MIEIDKINENSHKKEGSRRSSLKRNESPPPPPSPSHQKPNELLTEKSAVKEMRDYVRQILIDELNSDDIKNQLNEFQIDNRVESRSQARSVDSRKSKKK
jgi:hypothetical protein